MTAPRPFGTTPEGPLATLHTLDNGRLRVAITDFGGRIVALEAPDRRGEFGHVVLGFEDVPAYVAAGNAFGALLGRDANRIGDGCFTLDGETFHLSRNEKDRHTLHGGAGGFDMRLWHVEEAAPASLSLSLASPDGDQGFPGDLTVEATYSLLGSTLSLDFTARTSKPCPVSLSAHPYFNLGGVETRDVYEHEAMIAAAQFLPIDREQIVTGELRDLADTPFDFRRPKRIGAELRRPEEQLLLGRGYDHYFVLDPACADGETTAMRIQHDGTGRVLEIATTQPGGQFFTGNVLDGSVAGRGGIYRQGAGFAFEPQGFPNAPNRPGLPTTILQPDETYREVIRYRFGLQ
jgi:aldose 1-epimerase